MSGKKNGISRSQALHCARTVWLEKDHSTYENFDQIIWLPWSRIKCRKNQFPINIRIKLNTNTRDSRIYLRGVFDLGGGVAYHQWLRHRLLTLSESEWTVVPAINIPYRINSMMICGAKRARKKAEKVLKSEKCTTFLISGKIIVKINTKQNPNKLDYVQKSCNNGSTNRAKRTRSVR